jgi:hypothetical protein
MPIERDLSKIRALSDEGLFRWRADVRAILAGQRDAELSVLNEASIDEVVVRAGRAWAAGHDQ